MNAEEMRRRTKEFAKRIIKVCRELPNTMEGRLIGGQLFRCGTSVGCSYRAACRGRSKPDFISKIGIVLEEADEVLYWLEFIIETDIMKAKRLAPLMSEASQLVSIFVASLNTSKNKGHRA